jgi:hypothetical protein
MDGPLCLSQPVEGNPSFDEVRRPLPGQAAEESHVRTTIAWSHEVGKAQPIGGPGQGGVGWGRLGVAPHQPVLLLEYLMGPAQPRTIFSKRCPAQGYNGGQIWIIV